MWVVRKTIIVLVCPGNSSRNTKVSSFFFYEHMNKINKEVGNDHQATGGESDFNLPEVWAEKTMYIIFWYGSAFTAG